MQLLPTYSKKNPTGHSKTSSAYFLLPCIRLPSLPHGSTKSIWFKNLRENKRYKRGISKINSLFPPPLRDKNEFPMNSRVVSGLMRSFFLTFSSIYYDPQFDFLKNLKTLIITPSLKLRYGE